MRFFALEKLSKKYIAESGFKIAIPPKLSDKIKAYAAKERKSSERSLFTKFDINHSARRIKSQIVCLKRVVHPLITSNQPRKLCSI